MTYRNWARRVLVVVAIAAWPASESHAAEATRYVCPPCGHDCLETTFEDPGACGECGMALITLDEATSRASQPATPVGEARRVAVLIFEGVEIIDYTGPWEIFGSAGFEVFSVATSTEPLSTTFGMRVIPLYTIDQHPEPDIVVVPGGQVLAVQRDPQVQAWLKRVAVQADVVLSVCNGAFILAKAGLLDGMKATTTRHLIEGLGNAGNDITVVRDVRFVDNGKIVTSGGLSAGMDAALHVTSRYLGRDNAKRIAAGLEYDWRDE